MKVDIYEKTRTIEVPDGATNTKIICTDGTGYGYSMEADIHTVSLNGVRMTHFAIINQDDILPKYISRLKNMIEYHKGKKREVLNAGEEANREFLQILDNAPIRHKVKVDLKNKFKNKFSFLNRSPWR